MRWAIGVIVVLSGTAHADDGVDVVGAQPAERPLQSSERVAIAVNEPFGWTLGTIAASAYVGLTAHQLLRANFEYDQHMSQLDVFALGIVDTAAGGDGEYPRSGTGGTHDYGLAWMWFPRHVYSGFNLEAGVLVRHRDYSDTAEQTLETTKTTTVALRVMLGYSIRINPRLFMSAAIGLSAGPYSGGETLTDMDSMPPSTGHVVLPSLDWQPEAFLRFGVLLGPT